MKNRSEAGWSAGAVRWCCAMLVVVLGVSVSRAQDVNLPPPDRNWVNAGNADGISALESWLALGGQPDAVADELLDATLLHLAAKQRNADAAALLLAAGAMPDVPDRRGMTPLHWCAQSSAFTVAALLVDSGANVNARGANERTPLHCAVFSRQPDMIPVLLFAGADASLVDAYGFTPLRLALRHDFQPEITALVNGGVDQ